jgi:hypothetical protein
MQHRFDSSMTIIIEDSRLFSLNKERGSISFA